MAGSRSADDNSRDVPAPSRSDISDEQLADRMRTRGDTSAYGVLIERYRVRLMALSRRMLGSSQDEAEDVVQDALVSAFHKRATYRPGDPFRPWLYRIVINRCVDRLRSRGRHPQPASLEVLPEEPSARGEPLTQILSDERERRLEAAVAEMPTKYRTVFLLRHLDDLSYEDIARAAELPVGTVKTHLFRARAHLRQALEGYLEL